MTAAQTGPRPRWRRLVSATLRWFAWTLGGAVAVVLIVVIALLYSASFGRWVVEQAIERYGDAIAGDVSIGAVRGRLAGDLVIEDVRLSDKTGRPLIRAQRLRLGIDVGAALGGTLALGRLELSQAEVFVPTAGPGGFEDLAPATEDAPEPAPGLGPDLPLRIEADLLLDGLRVSSGATPGEAETLVQVDEANLEAWGEGRRANLELTVAGAVPSAGLQVERLSMVAAWDEPGATASAVQVRSNWGTLALDEAHLDVSTMDGSLDGLVVEPSEAWLEQTLGVSVAGAWTLRADGQGGPDSLELDLQVDAAQYGAATVRLAGRPTAPVDADLSVSGTVGPALLRSETSVDSVQIALAAEVRGDPQSQMEARLALLCRDCDPEGVPVSLALDVRGEPSASVGTAHGALMLATTAVGIEGELRDGGQWEAGLELSSLSLRRVGEIVGRFVQTPELAGHAGSRLRCRGTLEPLTADCDVRTAVRAGKPIRYADLGAHVQLGDTVQVEVDTLDVRAADVEVQLASGPARITWAQPELSIRELDVHVGTKTGRGRLTAQADVGGSGPQSVSARIRGLDLSAVHAFVPDLRVQGRLDGTLTVEGSREAPRLRAKVSARGLVLDGEPLGDIDVEASYAQQRARAKLRVRGGALRHADVEASVPLKLDATGSVRLLRHAAVRGRVRIEQADLEHALASAGLDAPVSGTVGLQAELRGSLARPEFSGTLEGTGLMYEDHSLGDVVLEVSHAPAQTEAVVHLRHPTIDEARVSARTRIDLDLARARAHWSASRDHAIELTLVRADVGRLLKEWSPDTPAAGTLDVQATMNGPLTEPDIDAQARVRDAVWDGRQLGEVELAASYRAGEERAELALSGRGPALAGLGLTASVPVTLSPGTGSVVWHPEQHHEVELMLAGVVLQKALRWAPQPVDLVGSGHLHATLRGSMTEPVIATDLELRRVRYGGRDVGDVALQARYADEAAQADLRVQRDARRIVTASVEAPLSIDLRRAEVTPHWAEEHRVRVEAPKVDRVLLDPFVALPEDLDLDVALEVEGGGPLGALLVTADLRGVVGWSDFRQPVQSQMRLATKEQTMELRLGEAGKPLLHVDGRTEIPLGDVVRGKADVTASPLAVVARADAFDLRMLRGLFSSVVVDTSGRLDLDATVGGSIGDPKLHGVVKVTDGAATVVPARQRLEGIVVDVVASNDRIELRDLVARSGRGTLHGSGRATFSSGRVRMDVDLRAKRIPIRAPGLPHLELTTVIDTGVVLQPERRTVSIAIAKTQVGVSTTKTVQAKAIPSDDAVRYVKLVGPDAVVPGPDVGRPTDGTEDAPKLETPMEIRVRLTDPVRIIGPAVDMPWDGAVTATVGPDGVRTEGAISTSQGYFSLLGNQFRITHGEVTIPQGENPVPYIDLTAHTRVAQVDVQAHVRGRVTKPELVFSSEPAMTQSQIFTLLVTGAADGQGANEGEVEAKAASMLAAFSNPALQRQLNERLHVDRVGVGFGETTEQPILSVGKHVTKKVYVESQYHHNAPPTKNRAQLEMRYRIAPRWSLETFFGDAAAGGVDLFWGRSFDIRE